MSPRPSARSASSCSNAPRPASSQRPRGQRYYKRCIEAVGQLDNASEEVRGFASRVSGDLRIGLIPTLTRAALAPALDQFTSKHPDVRVYIVEGYSGWLTDLVLNGELDFAVVPTFEGRVGLKSRLLVRDREMLVSNVSQRIEAVAAHPPEGFWAAEDHLAGSRQRSSPQHGSLFPDSRRRGGRR